MNICLSYQATSKHLAAHTGAQCSGQRMKMQGDCVKWHLLDLAWVCTTAWHFTSLLVIISVTPTDSQQL